MRLLTWIAAAVLLSGSAWAQPAPYRLDFQAALPGDGGWDYVSFDAARGLVFIGRPGGVLAARAADGTLVGRIGSAQGNHGAAPADDIDRVFTSESTDSAIGVYALSTLQRLQTIRLATEPDALLYDTARKWLVVMSRRGHSLIVIDAVRAQVLRTIDMGGPVEAAAIDDSGTLFVDLPDQNAVARVDLAGTVTARWPVAGCTDPSSLALDHAARRLFVGCRNRTLAMLDAGAGALLASGPIGDGSDSMVFDPARHLALSSNGEGFVSAVPELPSGLGQSVVVPTAKAARTMAADPATGRLFLVTADIARVDPPAAGQERPVVHYVPGSFRMMVYRPL